MCPQYVGVDGKKVRLTRRRNATPRIAYLRVWVNTLEVANVEDFSKRVVIVVLTDTCQSLSTNDRITVHAFIYN